MATSVLRIKTTDGWKDIAAIQGAQGIPGEQGEQGAPGKDGKTPVKGVDYWTAAEQQQMVNDVLAALPIAEEVAY